MKNSTLIPSLFKENTDRNWWFKRTKSRYLPPIFSFLNKEEFELLQSWYLDTKLKNLIGESNIPFMSFLQGLIMGNSINKIIQLGHYAGYSSLLIGFMLRKMDIKNSFVSIDIDKNVSDYTSLWIKKANLTDYVKIIIGNSTDKTIVNNSLEFLKDKPKLVIIDSSHQYKHTSKELSIWSKKIEKFGIIILHDVSKFASEFDYKKLGGVNKALKKFKNENIKFEVCGINENFHSIKKSISDVNKLTYLDGCGIGIIQKH
jgi:predicted O-methyltransferase YrrM